jgi:dual specificity tyrosine-phosphorylation-regulated kinase 2/3/4
MFSALDQVHRIGAVHCDMKPENVLLVPGSNALIKLIDFGSSCFDGRQKYEYIQSRFYRAPEVIIGIPYGAPMDVWSAALIIVELLIGKPLFPGDDEEEQLAMISELLGDPDPDWVAGAKRKDDFFESDGSLRRENLAVMRFAGTMNLKHVLQTNDGYLLDFIMRCLQWEPSTRMTASQAMQHPWIRMKEVQMGSRQEPVLPVLKTGVSK